MFKTYKKCNTNFKCYCPIGRFGKNRACFKQLDFFFLYLCIWTWRMSLQIKTNEFHYISYCKQANVYFFTLNIYEMENI